MMDLLATELGLGTAWDRARALGPGPGFMVLGYVLERATRIANPKAYTHTLVARLENGAMTWRGLLDTNDGKEGRSAA